jgi:N6-adenosine-specific RNA methylase IME4
MIKDDQQLLKIDIGIKAIAEARSIPEVKLIRDKAAAIIRFIKQQHGGLLLQNEAAHFKIRAERRLGALLKETVEHGGDHGNQYVATLHRERLATLPPEVSWSQSHRWQTMASVPEDVVEAYISEIKQEEKELTSLRIYRLAKQQENRERQEVLRNAPIFSPTGKYRCLVIDPPWQTIKIEREERPNQVLFDYPTMTEEQLLAYAIADYAEENCHLYLWTTHKFLPVALRLAEHWGFNYECLLTWIKNVGFTPFSWMYSTEHILFCRKGNLDLLIKGQRLDFTAKVREHSRKPEEFYDLVRLVSPGPRLDIFSRESHEGFAQLGNETEKFNELA